MSFKEIILVGVGPGDPSLMTLSAVNAIEEATVVAYPIAQEGGKSMAAQIASKWITRDKIQIPIVFPMVLDADPLKDAWKEACKILVDQVLKGEKVCFLSQGDISLFSTGSYVLLELLNNHPLLSVRVIPGVSSIAAAAAEGLWPLALQKDQLLILSTPDQPEKLDKLLSEAALKNRVIALLKIGHRWSWIRPLLESKGLLESSLFAQRIGFSDEIIVPACDLDDLARPYFSLLLVRQNWPDIIPSITEKD